MDWLNILRNNGWLSLKTVDPPPRPIGQDVVRLGEGMYAYSVPHNQALDHSDPGVPYAGLVVWAPNDGAALRALTMTFEGDDPNVRQAPPAELSQYLHGATYGEILQTAQRMHLGPFEWASYRIASDGLFVRKAMCVGNITYFFRELRADVNEAPFAVGISLSQPTSS
jgi:hypothetical protein